ncbi:EI24 domain-containing protein [bacterium]|jgi:uncharacterized protein involved in cysteine biosynthesis|nr:EI24 domain-containing protein [bacterium]
MTSRIQSLVYGFTLPLLAAKLIASKPKLLLWSLLPASITLFAYRYAIVKIQDFFKGMLTHYVTQWGYSPDSWWMWVLQGLTQILLLLVGALTFSFVAGIISSPFNDFLAENAEEFAEPQLPSVPQTSFGTKVRLIGIDLAKTLVSGSVMFFAILLSWVPILNFFAFVLTFLLITFQYISYPQTRRGVGVKTGLGFLWSHLYACGSFGFILSVLFTIPILSALFLPVAVVGGTLLYARAQRGAGSFQLK